MKKILHVVSCLSNGGTEAFIMNNFRQLDRQNFQFDFMVFVDDWKDHVEEIENLEGSVYFVGVPSIWKIRSFLKNAITAMRNNGPYDVVHSHVNIQNGWVMLAAKQAGVPIRISHSHDADMGGHKNVPRFVYEAYERHLIFKYATSIAACSKVAAECLYGEGNANRAIVIPNGINLDDFLKGREEEVLQLRKEFGIHDGSIVIGNITRFEDKKNSLFIVSVFAEIKKLLPNSHLIMGGDDGGLLVKTQALVNSLNLEESVSFVGRRNDVPACLKLVDIYLFPSKFEGLAIAFLEAQASGCLSVASTAVTKEGDMGVGGTLFIDLDLPPAEWAKKIVDAFEKWERPSAEVIQRCFTSKGFEIAAAHRHLTSLYKS